MIRITEKELEELLEKEKKTSGRVTRFMNNVGKVMPPIILIEGIYASFLHYRFSCSFFLTFLLFILADAVLLILIPMLYGVSIDLKQAKQGGGNLFSAINMMRLSLKYHKLSELVRNEICSDKFIAEIDKSLQTEKNLCSACWLKYMKASALLLQDKIPEAELLIEELRSLNTKKTALFIDLPLLEIDLADKKDDMDAYFTAIKNHRGYLERRKKNEFRFALLYTSLCAYNERLKGNFIYALQYIELREKYNEASRASAAAGNAAPPKESNLYTYNRAAYALEKAKCFYFLGEYERASVELDTADLHIADLTCDIPRIYIKEHSEFLSKIHEKLIQTE